MKNICLINGSLRGKKASSLQFIQDISRRFPDAEYSQTCITVRAGANIRYLEETLKTMADADALVLVFPLFAYGLPGALMRLLEDYYQYLKAGHYYNRSASVYVIVNCGFARPQVTSEAVRVVHNFCRRLSLNWRFAVCIGTGPVVVMMRKIPFLHRNLKRGYADIVSDIACGSQEKKEDILVKPVIPEPVLIRIKNYYEKKGKMIEPVNKPKTVYGDRMNYESR
jgi:hypothetical protein